MYIIEFIRMIIVIFICIYSGRMENYYNENNRVPFFFFCNKSTS